MIVRTATVALALLAVSGLPVQAQSGPTQGASARFGGRVPLLCRVQLASAVGVPGEDGMIDLGTAQELCNAPRGYRVILRHPTELVGAAVFRNGQRIPLSASGVQNFSEVW